MDLLCRLRRRQCEVNQPGRFRRPVEELHRLADPVQQLDVGPIGKDDEFVARRAACENNDGVG